MSNLKLILIGAGAIALLAGALVALKLTEKEDEGNTTDSSAVIVSLWEGKTENVAKVEVKNPLGEYEITKKPYADLENISSAFTIKAFEDYPLQYSYIYTIANNFSALTEARLIEENAEDIDKYGLGDDAAALITITYDDGAKRSFRIGSTSPTSSSEAYFCMEGESSVYMVSDSNASNYREDPLFFISTTVLEEPAEEDYPVINWLEVERKDLDYGKIRYDLLGEAENTYGSSASHAMTEPVYAFLNVSYSTEITNGMFGLQANEIMMLNPSDDQLAIAGVANDPFCKVTMNCGDNKSYVLRLSEKMDVDTDEGTQSFYLGYLEGVDILYYFTAENIPWVDYSPMDITSSMILGTYVYDIGSLTVEGGGKVLAFEGSGDSESYSAKLNGAEIDTEVFRSFYAFLLKAPAEEMLLDEPSGALLCSVTLKTQSGKTEETLEFYQIEGERKVAISHNGKPSFVCRQAYLDRLISNISLVLNGESIVNSW